jgi:hypothetical protein
MTVPDPVGVTVTLYICGDGFELPPLPPQATSRPAAEIASAVNSTASARFLRRVNGAPSNTEPNITAPPLFQGRRGEWLDALFVAVMVSVELPVVLEAKLTEGALAETADGEPLIELTLVANETVPVKLVAVRWRLNCALLPAGIVIEFEDAPSVYVGGASAAYSAPPLIEPNPVTRS